MLQFWVQVLIQQSFAAEMFTHRCGSETLDDTRETPCTKTPPLEVVNAMGSPSTCPIVESGPLTGNRPQDHRKGEENYLHTVRSIRQSLSN
jgi:hypothetical protein